MKKPILYIIIPCCNEETVLPITCKMFLDKINELISSTNNSNEIKEDDITGLIGTIIFSIVAMTIGILIAVGLSSR